MPDFLKVPFTNGPAVSPLDVLVRLLAALALGGVVAWIYRRTRTGVEMQGSFTSTLVLLAVLIAMVTQVIGDNIARAFSLVGALSIVRFRTVVRDTEDTAYVIFAVVVGMAVGAQNLWVAVIGLAVVAVAAFALMKKRRSASLGESAFVLNLRIGLGQDVDKLLDGALDGCVSHRELLSIQTAKQGASLDVSLLAQLNDGISAGEIVKKLNRIEGVQSVSIERRGAENG